MNLVKKERLLFICNWDKQKEKTWSGTPYHLMMELKKYFNISDVDVSLNFVQKVICKLLSFKIEKGKIAKESSVFNKHISKIMTKKAKKAIKKYDGEYVLEIGDLFSTKEKKVFVYQDLNALYLMDIYQNNPALFKDTGFSCTFKSIKEREKYALDYYSRVQKCFFMGNWITEYTKNKISAECVCVGAGANTKLINSRRKRENKDFNFLFIGRDFERKNGPLVVSAFNILHKKFKNTKLTICGPQSIKTEYQVGGGGITLLGDIPFSKLDDVYEQSDCFVMPSKFEAFGIVFVESLINGVPVIAKNSFEMKNIIRHGENGFLIDENSVDELVKYMERIMTADKIFHIVNEEKEQIRNKYTWGNVARLMYENIVK